MPAPAGYRGGPQSPEYGAAPERPAYSGIPDGLWVGGRPEEEDPGAGYHDFADYDDEPPPRSRLGLIAAIVAAWLVVSIAVLGFLLLVRGPKSNHTSASSTGGASASSSQSAPASPNSSPLPAGWVKQAADDQTDCAAHSYGQVHAFFAKTPCAALHRLLATTNQGGRQVIVASYVVHFATPQQAASYNALVTADGTGDVNNLLSEGAQIPGGPSKLPNAAFASRQSGSTIQVAEAAFASGPSDSGNATLKSVAAQGVGG